MCHVKNTQQIYEFRGFNINIINYIFLHIYWYVF